MDAVRYYLALLLVILMPGAFVFWFSIHPFVRFWRRVGTRWTYPIHYAMMAVVAVALFQWREAILAIDYGTNLILIGLSVPIYVLAVIVAKERRKQLGMRRLLGYPELDPQRYPSTLVTEGIYRRIRHPRYVEMLLFLLAHALLANYLATYAVFLISWLGILIVVQLEERELIERFGEEYVRYCERVPRFVPRF
jgi:protein-S-isoprenylcysteine O-methyltransferase Ste14